MSFLGHMLRGELDDLIGMLASDCRFWFSGDLVNSGLWEGKEAVGAIPEFQKESLMREADAGRCSRLA